MSGAGAALSHINTAGFALIAVLALATAGGELSALFKQVYPIVALLDLVLFMASAYALLELRNTLLPGSLRTRLAVLVVLTVSTALVVPLALGPQNQQPTAFALIVVCAQVLEWALCIIEPAMRFRFAARRLPVVQRKRLRALSTGYLGIAGVLVLRGRHHAGCGRRIPRQGATRRRGRCGGATAARFHSGAGIGSVTIASFRSGDRTSGWVERLEGVLDEPPRRARGRRSDAGWDPAVRQCSVLARCSIRCTTAIRCSCCCAGRGGCPAR